MGPLRGVLTLLILVFLAGESSAQVWINPNPYGFGHGTWGINARLGHHGSLVVGGGWPVGVGYPGLMLGGYRQNTLIYAPQTLIQQQPIYIPVPVVLGNNPGDGLEMLPDFQGGMRANPPAGRNNPAPERRPAAVPRKDAPREAVPPPRKAEPRPAPPPPNLPLPPQPPDPEKDPIDEQRRQMALGKQAFTDREYGKAVQRFQQANRVAPPVALGYFLLGQSYLALGKYLDAQEAILEGLKQEPGWPQSAFHPADLYGDHPQELVEHREQLRAVLDLNPRQAVLLFLYGYTLWFDGQRDQGRDWLQRAQPGLPFPGILAGFLKP